MVLERRRHCGAFLLAAGILVFLYNVARSLQHGKIAGPNPWDAADPRVVDLLAAAGLQLR